MKIATIVFDNDSGDGDCYVYSGNISAKELMGEAIDLFPFYDIIYIKYKNKKIKIVI